MSVTVSGVNYKIGKLDAMRQFHVMRRLSGVASALGDTVGVVMRSGGVKALLEGKGPDPVKVIEPLTRAISAMSDADSEYVIMNCLSVIQRQVAGDTGWAPLISSGQLMYQDLDLPAMLQLVWRVLEGNLSNFFSALPTGSLTPGAETGESGPTSQTIRDGS